MASSSVSQDDIDNDFEKNSRRSRIRTARARQINPSGCRIESNQAPGLEAGDQNGGEDNAGGANAGGTGANSKYNKLVANANDESAENETSPKPIMRGGGGKEKRPTKIQHGNKGKQQRDRRKLREKRRSTGVVHLASTESTGGSTTGEDDENSDQQPNVDRVLIETRRNTHQNESIANSYRQAQEKLGWSECDQPPSTSSNGGTAPASLHPPSGFLSSSRGKPRRDKSPSDLEADDENDHDSLNQSASETGSNLSLTTTGATSGAIERTRTASTSLNDSNTPVGRPTTPTGEPIEEDFTRVVEENKQFHSMLEEKDRRIHLLEFKVAQLMKDTRTISEENARYQKENNTLVRALSALTAKEKTT